MSAQVKVVGTPMDSEPAMTSTVALQALPPVPETGQVLPAAAEVTVLVTIVFALSRLLTVTE